MGTRHRALDRMRILITGVGGFVGGILAENLLAAGHEVTGVYLDSIPRLSIDSKRHYGLRLIKTDLASSCAGLGKADWIIHAAAKIKANPLGYARSNVLATVNVVNHAQSIRAKGIIYLSSLSAHGSAKVQSINESTPFYSPGTYGLSKAFGECVLRDCAEALPSLSIRLPAVVGENQFASWIGQVLHDALSNQPIAFYNGSSLFNNVIHVSEVSRFVALVIDRGLQGFEVVDVGASQAVPLRQAVERVVSKANSKSTLIEMDGSGRTSYWIDLSNLRKKFGFQPATTTHTIDMYVDENLSAKHGE